MRLKGFLHGQASFHRLKFKKEDGFSYCIGRHCFYIAVSRLPWVL